MKEWLDENREALRLQRRLNAATHDWLHSEKDPSFLARGARLQQIEDWSNNSDIALNANEAVYFNLPRSQDYLIYSNLASLAKTAINCHIVQPVEKEGFDASVYRWEAVRFRSDDFAAHLETIMSYRHRLETRWSVRRLGDEATFLYSPSTVAIFFCDLVIRLFLFRETVAFTVDVRVDGDDLAFCLHLTHLDSAVLPHLSVYLEEPTRTALGNGWRFLVDQQSAKIVFPCDRASENEAIDYSV